MNRVPDTRVSLILRLRNPDDAAAWRRFVALYQPVIYRVCRRRGWQHEDAVDLVQEVFLAVARAVGGWDPSGEGRFRSWLYRVLHSKLVDHLRRQPRAIGQGGSSMALWIQQQPDSQSGLSAEIEHEYRRELFQRASLQVQGHVHETTWQAFWRTSVEGQSAEQVAQKLGLTVGAVYIARSRVLARLREYVQSCEDSLTGKHDHALR